MKQNVPVSDIMSTELVVLYPEQTLYEVEKLLNIHNIRHIPVVENERIVGIISRSDLLRVSFSESTDDDEGVESMVFDTFSIPQVMTRVPVTVESDATIMEVAEILSRQSFHSLPVVEKGKLVGIVTTTDLINYLLTQYYILHY